MSSSEDDGSVDNAKKVKKDAAKANPESKRKEEERKALVEKLKRMKEILKKKQITSDQHKKMVLKEA